MNGIMKSSIGFAVSDQLGIRFSSRTLEFLYDVSVGKLRQKKGTLRVFAENWCDYETLPVRH